MEVINRNEVEVKLGNETKRIKFTFGKDLKIAEIMTEYIKKIQPLAKQNVDETALKTVMGNNASEAELEAAKSLLQTMESPIATLGEYAMSIQNAKVQVCSELLTEYDETGNVKTPVTPMNIMYDEKYSTGEGRDEIEDLFAFAYTRFFDIIEEQESRQKKFAAKKTSK